MSGAVLLAAIGGSPGIVAAAFPEPNAFQNPCGLFLGNDGSYDVTDSQIGNWVTPATAPIAALYQAKADVTAGALDGGSDSTGTWLDLSSTRQWYVTATSATITLSIREKGSTIVRMTQTGIDMASA